jgi:hypothetical protein
MNPSFLYSVNNKITRTDTKISTFEQEWNECNENNLLILCSQEQKDQSQGIEHKCNRQNSAT